MRFRTPELFLGCFLTIAVFSVGMLFASRYPVQTTQSPTTEKTQQAAADKGEPKGFWETATTDPVAAFTLCLVFVGGLQAYLFLRQLVIIRISLDDAKIAALAAGRAAKATEDAVELSRKTAQQQLRAYLFIKTPKMVLFAHGKNCGHEVWIRNYGQTPADNVIVVTNTDFFEPNRLPFPELEEPKELSKSSIAPSGEIIFTTVTDAPLTADQVQGVASGQLAFFVWGEIRYTDVFGRSQITHFRLRFGKAQLHLGNGAMMICDEGNQAT
jgi:hypothetical protein